MRSTLDRGVTISSDFDRRSRFAAIPASATVSRDLLSGCAGRSKWEIRGKLDQANINERVLFPDTKDSDGNGVAMPFEPAADRERPGYGACTGTNTLEAMLMNAKQVAEDILFYRTMMVNVFIVRDGGSWFLVDAGLGGYEQSIRRAAEDFVGSDAPPAAIVLTHGHFDHVGSLAPLLERWNVPVYAHPLERPYLTGRSSYPPPDPLVGGGAMSLLSRLYPRGPIDIGDRLQFLQEDGYIPFASVMALDLHAGPQPRARIAVPRTRPGAHRRGCGDDDQAGVGDRRRDTAARAPWSSRLLHAGLGGGPRVGREARRARTGSSRQRPR